MNQFSVARCCPCCTDIVSVNPEWMCYFGRTQVLTNVVHAIDIPDDPLGIIVDVNNPPASVTVTYRLEDTNGDDCMELNISGFTAPFDYESGELWPGGPPSVYVFTDALGRVVGYNVRNGAWTASTAGNVGYGASWTWGYQQVSSEFCWQEGEHVEGEQVSPDVCNISSMAGERWLGVIQNYKPGIIDPWTECGIMHNLCGSLLDWQSTRWYDFVYGKIT